VKKEKGQKNCIYKKILYLCGYKSAVKMKRQRIYIDTSIVGGFFDIEFEKETKLLFQRLENNEVTFVLSTVLGKELENAPLQVKNLLDNYDENSFERVDLTDEAKELANKYIAENVVGETSLDDCRHIALATINNVDVLASWNFKHIVNLTRIRGYNAVNLKNGYATIEIRNPKDLIDYGKEV
jgi:predicted nucleic acid-binding protein